MILVVSQPRSIATVLSIDARSAVEKRIRSASTLVTVQTWFHCFLVNVNLTYNLTSGMAPQLLIQTALDQAILCASDIERILKSSGINDDPFAPQSPISAPNGVDIPRKRLADAAARLLQLSTDPKEYLDNIAMGVRTMLPLLQDIISQILTTVTVPESHLSIMAGKS